MIQWLMQQGVLSLNQDTVDHIYSHCSCRGMLEPLQWLQSQNKTLSSHSVKQIMGFASNANSIAILNFLEEHYTAELHALQLSDFFYYWTKVNLETLQWMHSTFKPVLFYSSLLRLYYYQKPSQLQIVRYLCEYYSLKDWNEIKDTLIWWEFIDYVDNEYLDWLVDYFGHDAQDRSLLLSFLIGKIGVCGQRWHLTRHLVKKYNITVEHLGKHLVTGFYHDCDSMECYNWLTTHLDMESITYRDVHTFRDVTAIDFELLKARVEKFKLPPQHYCELSSFEHYYSPTVFLWWNDKYNVSEADRQKQVFSEFRQNYISYCNKMLLFKLCASLHWNLPAHFCQDHQSFLFFCGTSKHVIHENPDWVTENYKLILTNPDRICFAFQDIVTHEPASYPLLDWFLLHFGTVINRRLDKMTVFRSRLHYLKLPALHWIKHCMPQLWQRLCLDWKQFVSSEELDVYSVVQLFQVDRQSVVRAFQDELFQSHFNRLCSKNNLQCLHNVVHHYNLQFSDIRDLLHYRLAHYHEDGNEVVHSVRWFHDTFPDQDIRDFLQHCDNKLTRVYDNIIIFNPFVD